MYATVHLFIQYCWKINPSGAPTVRTQIHYQTEQVSTNDGIQATNEGQIVLSPDY